MSRQLAITGNGVSVNSQQELQQDRKSVLQVQIRAAEVKAAAFEKFTASLPGNNNEMRYTANIQSAAKDLERLSLVFNRELRFHVDQESHEVIIKVIDPETDKVIKILPPEELRRLHASFKEAIGFLFDEQV
ncbi:MAG: flagellar protein FlaG [Treponema sp.]|jgi:flagellar protein FlaG|nr:flagellar protein FlaG [Treponema sp.]